MSWCIILELALLILLLRTFIYKTYRVLIDFLISFASYLFEIYNTALGNLYPFSFGIEQPFQRLNLVGSCHTIVNCAIANIPKRC